MSRKRTDTLDRETRLNDVLLRYVEAAQAGQPLDRAKLLAAHPELRADLEDFFASHDEMERLAAPLRVAADESPTGPDTSATDVPATELGQLGDFRILREVGRGGMGVVYEAEQISLRRRVALKVLPFAAAIDPKQLQRFQNEALAAAHLRHENVVPVYAVGCERGVHYYAMQFVDGQSLAALIADLRRRESPPTTAADTDKDNARGGLRDTWPDDATAAHSVSISQQRSSGGRRYANWVAGLGRQAALALEHAHQAGIVHRDIKPANLLLDPRGQLWVADFGLAQFSTNAALTVSGEVLGTLRYASPEQAQARPGVVDHRSDIYSLGATLYELLTLHPIFDGRDRNELLRQIANDEPYPPRLLDRTIPVELETILLKAVAKEPDERYATVRDFADDLQRFLDDVPIRARRPTLLEQATKWARRHRHVVASALGAMVLLLAGLSVATFLTARAYDSERIKAKEAEESFRQARQAVDRFAAIGAVELAGDPSQERARRLLLETALAYYQDFIEQRGDDPALKKEFEDSRAQMNLILDELALGNWFDRYLLLIRRPSIHDDLELTNIQRQTIDRLGDGWLNAIRESRNLDPRQRDRVRADLVKRQQEDAAEVLGPEKMDRFFQIALQLSGPSAFADQEVAEFLDLTADQKQKIREIQGQTGYTGPRLGGPQGGKRGEGVDGKGGKGGGKGGRGGKGGGPPDKGGPGGRGPMGPPDEYWRALDEKVKKLLTDEQWQRWQELIGKPFQPGGGYGPPLRESGGRRGPGG